MNHSPLKDRAPREQAPSAQHWPTTVVRRQTRDIRLHKHADYQRVYQASRKQFSSTMTWFIASRPSGPDTRPNSGPRVGLTVGKVIGKAHERNRIKRRMRELVRKHIALLPNGADLILHPRRAVMTMDFVKLDTEVQRIFRQAATQFRNQTPARVPLAKSNPAQSSPSTADSSQS